MTTHDDAMVHRHDDLIETPVGPITDIRSRAAGWHFAKEALSGNERRILADLEAVLGVLDSQTRRGYLHGYRCELPTWDEPAAPDGAAERPKPDGNALVQAIVVGPGGTHLEVIDAVMRASVDAYFDRGLDNPTWGDWLAGSFTKTVRSTNATKLAQIAALDGTTVVTVGDATAVALPPMRRNDLPRPVAWARVSGLDRPRSTSEEDRPLEGHSVLVNDSLDMTTGKAAAQAAHALMVRAISGGWGPTHVADAKAVPVSGALFDVFAHLAPEEVIHDAGWTEIPAGSATALAVEIDAKSLRPAPTAATA